MSRIRLPLLSLLLVGVSGLAQLLPELAEGFAFQRDANLSGECWRVLTGHLCHYNYSHFIGDAGAFLVWSTVVKMVSRRLLACALIGTIVLSGAWLVVVPSAPSEYRGLSAVDCALAAQLFTLGFFEQRIRCNRVLFSAYIAPVALFAAKFAYEFATGHASLAPNLGVGVRVTPEAHVIGVMIGVSSAWNYATHPKHHSFQFTLFGIDRHGNTSDEPLATLIAPSVAAPCIPDRQP